MPTSLKQDVLQLRKAKTEMAAANKTAKIKTANFKERQSRVLERMEHEDVDAIKVSGTLFSPVRDKLHGEVNDRAEFVRWAFSESGALQEFLDVWADPDNKRPPLKREALEAGLEYLIQALNETPFIKIAEDKQALSTEIRRRLDDGEILPPGTTFYHESYISQRNG